MNYQTDAIQAIEAQQAKVKPRSPPSGWWANSSRTSAAGSRGARSSSASLFGGIGGFPLIWERLNGPGSCLWTSEIGEFPAAVTKKRFCGKERW